MRVLLYDRQSTETTVVEALSEGIRREGDECAIQSKHDYHPDQIRSADLIVTGRVAASMHILDECRKQKQDVLYYDKGYLARGWNTEKPSAYFRFAFNDYHPTDYFQDIPRPADRWKQLKINLQKRRRNGKNIVFAGCSLKFARLHGFDITEYATQVIHEIKKFTDRPIVYRPKKTVKELPPPIPGTIYSYSKDKTIHNELKDAYALVTFSSNAALDAVLAGVPAFVLGPGIAKPVSNTDLAKMNDPYFPEEAVLKQWCYDVAYCQWNLEEMRSGEAWRDFKKTLAYLKQKRLLSQ